MDIKFDCKKCGQCCRKIWVTGLLKEFENDKGECIHLTEDNLCDIYDSRPDVCNVEKMFELCFKNTMTYDEYLCENYKVCAKLQKDR